MVVSLLVRAHVQIAGLILGLVHAGDSKLIIFFKVYDLSSPPLILPVHTLSSQLLLARGSS